MKERISKIIVLFVAILLYRCNLFADTFINVTKYVDNSYTNIEIIEKNKYFKDAHIPGTLSINYINLKSNDKKIIYNGEEYKKCEGIKLFSDDKYLIEFNNLTQPVEDNLNKHYKGVKWDNPEPNPNDDWWCIKISKIQSIQEIHFIA